MPPKTPPRPRRHRCIAPPDVGMKDYYQMILKWVGNSTIENVVGPTMVDEVRQVTPKILLRQSELIMALIGSGVLNVVTMIIHTYIQIYIHT